jgi:hypothetical protein
MPDVDIEEIKRSILNGSEPGLGSVVQPDVTALVKRGREADALTASRLLTKTGIDPSELHAEIARNHQPYRDARARMKAAGAADVGGSRKAAFEAEIGRQRTLLSPFAGRIVPLDTPTFTVLSEPILITQFPNSYLYFLQSESVAPFDSRIRVHISSDTSTTVTYQFWYFWYNDSDSFVLVSATSSLIFNGAVFAECGESGFFGDKKLSCAILTWLLLKEQGATNGSASPMTDLVNMNLSGGIFSDGRGEQWLNYQPRALDCSNYVVGPRSGLLITANAMLGFAFTDHEVANDGDPSNNVIMDFATEDSGYFIQSTSVGVVAFPLRLL